MRLLIAATVLPGTDPSPFVAAETARVQELLTDGTAENLYIRSDGTGAYLVLNTVDMAAADAVVNSLPLVQAGLLDITYAELAPAQQPS